jgi:hypothetical protein
MIGLGRPRADEAAEDRPVVLPADSAGNFFRVTSRSALDYVFRHGFDVVETFVLVFVYLIFLFVGGHDPQIRGGAQPVRAHRAGCNWTYRHDSIPLKSLDLGP